MIPYLCVQKRAYTCKKSNTTVRYHLTKITEMKKVTRIFSLLFAAAWLVSVPVYAVAQDYDDDLYYSPSKAAEKKKKEEAARRAAQQAKAARSARQAQNEQEYSGDYMSADSYTPSVVRPLEMDVDTYNRRTDSGQDSYQNISETPDFANTRRIERFHNPDVVVNTGDTALMQYYYSAPEKQDINVYVINSIDYPSWELNYGYPSWRWRFGRPYWSLSWGYDPWFDYGWGYDPFWGPTWGWGPSWAWGPSWGWGCTWPGHWHHNPWHPGHYPIYGSNNWGYDRPGATRPHRPAYGTGTGSSSDRRPGYNGGNYRPSTSGSGSYRPGNMGRPSYGNNSGSGNGNYRPSSPSGSGSDKGNYRPSNNSRRGRDNSSGTNNRSNNRSSSSDYNRSNSNWGNSGGSYRGSGSYGGGSRGGGSYGGGGGGGASRGRGR